MRQLGHLRFYRFRGNGVDANADVKQLAPAAHWTRHRRLGERTLINVEQRAPVAVFQNHGPTAWPMPRTPPVMTATGMMGCHGLLLLRKKGRRKLLPPAQPLNQAIEFIHRAKLNCQLAHVFAPSVTFNLFFDAYFDASHQQIGQLFFDAARIT